MFGQTLYCALRPFTSRKIAGWMRMRIGLPGRSAQASRIGRFWSDRSRPYSLIIGSSPPEGWSPVSTRHPGPRYCNDCSLSNLQELDLWPRRRGLPDVGSCVCPQKSGRTALFGKEERRAPPELETPALTSNIHRDDDAADDADDGHP